MTIHIYAFGSICRGEVEYGSDIDLLALVKGYNAQFDPDTYSIYSYERISEIWDEGNPFAWHLYLESKLIYSSDQSDILKIRGQPKSYYKYVNDCEKFFSLWLEARASFEADKKARVFDLSTLFLSIRNIATCFSLGVLNAPDFSRHSALHLGDYSLTIPTPCFAILEKSRLLCTRGYGSDITSSEMKLAPSYFPQIEEWMESLVRVAKHHEARI